MSVFKDLFYLVKDPAEFFKMKKAMAKIEEVIRENYDSNNFVLVSKDVFQKLVDSKNAATPILNNGLQSANSKLRQSLLESRSSSETYDSYEDDYGDYSFYGDDSTIFSPDSKKDEFPPFDCIKDSVYNFACVYLYGNHRSNYLTVFSLDELDHLYVQQQKQFNLRTHLDVIEACEHSVKKFDLDRIVFVRNTVMNETTYNTIIQGMEVEIETNLSKEFINFDDKIEEALPMLNGGSVLVSPGPWYFDLQNEINRYMSATDPRSMKASPPANMPYAKVKSFLYGVDFWSNNMKVLKRNILKQDDNKL